MNKTNGKYYVGSSNNIYRRWREHKKMLKLNIHSNDYLQSSWNMHGNNNFEFIIIENVLPIDLLISEQKHLDIARAESDKCYNLKFEALGGQWNEHSKDKMRGSNNPMFGKTHKESIRKVISEKLTGRKLSDSTKLKMSQYRQGKTYSEETKRRISESKKGINNPNYGKPMSVEHRRKIGEANKKKNRHQSLSPVPVTI